MELSSSSVPSRRVVAALWMALLAGAVVLGALFWLVGNHRVQGLDRHAFDVLAADRGGLLARVSKPAAAVGPWLLGLVVLIAIARLVRDRAWLNASAVVTGFVLVGIGVHIGKAQEARPRPPGPLLHAGGFSFPSGDSALCIGFVAVVIAVAHLTADRTRRAVLIAGGCVLAVAGGLLFVALRVHYLSDVIGGWALGVFAFAAGTLASSAVASNRGQP